MFSGFLIGWITTFIFTEGKPSRNLLDPFLLETFFEQSYYCINCQVNVDLTEKSLFHSNSKYIYNFQKRWRIFLRQLHKFHDKT